jgi:hypothetical protein
MTTARKHYPAFATLKNAFGYLKTHSFMLCSNVIKNVKATNITQKTISASFTFNCYLCVVNSLRFLLPTSL